jgi:hypothetical protein
MSGGYINASEQYTPWACGFAERVLAFGANGFYSPDNSYALTQETDELYLKVSDFGLGSPHKAYLQLPLPALAPVPAGTQAAGYSPQMCISKFFAEVQGDSFDGMPSTAASIVLHGKSAGTIASASDLSANVTALNTRHLISYTPSTPILLDYLERYMIESRSPAGGSGTGRFWKLYQVVLQITPSAIIPADGAGRVYASKMPL